MWLGGWVKVIINVLERRFLITTLVYWIFSFLIGMLMWVWGYSGVDKDILLIITLIYDIIFGTTYLFVIIRRCCSRNIQPHIIIILYFISDKLFLLGTLILLGLSYKNPTRDGFIHNLHTKTQTTLDMLERILIVVLFILFGYGYYLCVTRFNFGDECYLYNTTGYYCATCGVTRMLIEILRGNILGGIKYNPIYTINIIIFGYILIKYIMGQKLGWGLILSLVILNTTIVVFRNIIIIRLLQPI